MIAGTTVTVLIPTAASVDEFNNEALEWGRLEVQNVLVAPADTADVVDSNRPDGNRARLILHFPKAFSASLRNCRVEVLGKVWEVEGDPQPFMPDLTPGVWNRPVKVVRVDG